MSNRLSGESSPYLLQHANNPVDWYPWGEEALTRAQMEDKPIFLSIGYASCHWCHVMAHESFEDAETAAIMNEHFVNIKVDREERPDLDTIYMTAVVAMSDQGGWPMSIFLTPDGVPIYGGTYFPPEDRYGMPSFKRVLLAVARAYREERDKLREGGGQVLAYMQQSMQLPQRDGAGLAFQTLERAYLGLANTFDAVYGGFGGAPKFPPAMALEFLLRYHLRTQEEHALQMVRRTLTRMAHGGLYDQLGGGFHRYATDVRWLIPHFEKMLYDNALLARVYLHAWQVEGIPLYRRVATQTLDYVVREMTHPAGGFYSAQDADSEGEEGKFYLWSYDELAALLGRPDAALVARHFGVTERGNFAGKNVLYIAMEAEDLAALMQQEGASMHAMLERACQTLLQARSQRIPPEKDDKVLTGWNGLMMGAFAEAARILKRPDYLEVARRNAEFVLREMFQDNRLMRSWRQGTGARHGAYLEDYAAYAAALLALYQATFEVRWFLEARALADIILERFADPKGGFFDTRDDHEPVLVRPRQLQDSAVPSGNALAADVLFHMATYTGDHRYRDAAEQLLHAMAAFMEQHPSSFGHWLSVAAYHLAPPVLVAVVGSPEAADTRDLLAVLFSQYRPHVDIAFTAPGGEAMHHILALKGREMQGGRATAYLCHEFSCRPPILDAKELEAQLQHLSSG
ncbi:MAG: thioredoxin domain-containing protein [Anaerolineae bacterium]